MALPCNQLLLKENNLQSRKPSLSNLILQSQSLSVSSIGVTALLLETSPKKKKKIKRRGEFQGKTVIVLPWWLSDKESTCKAGDTSSIPGPGRPPGEGSGNPLQYSCLGNPTDKGDLQATVREVTKSWI